MGIFKARLCNSKHIFLFMIVKGRSKAKVSKKKSVKSKSKIETYIMKKTKKIKWSNSFTFFKDYE